jgi:pyruvate,water dikinase
MSHFLTRLKSYFFREKKPPTEAVEELRQAFRAKYHAFKLLLTANNTALQLMAEMETTLHGHQSFGMTFVRSHSTAACVNVFSLIKYLNELSANKYQPLVPVFESIREKIDSCLRTRPHTAIHDLVLPLAGVAKEMADGVGSKMANLGEIKTRLPGTAVPQGFVITAAAYELFLSHNRLQEEINRRLQTLEMEGIADLYRQSSEIQMLIIGAEMPPDLSQAILQAYEEMVLEAGGQVRVALRSSAIGEDALDTSFAGQYRSELNVSRENLLTVYKEILASKYSLTATSYRLNKGLRDEDVPMCVGCMRMVEALAGGVMYSRDPTDVRRDTILINAVHGLAKTVVDGSVTPDLWEISRGHPPAIIRKEIRLKGQKAVCLAEEGVFLETDAAGEEPSLTDAQALDLARIALTLEEHFQTPQDIEWSIDREGRIYILQSRPLKQLSRPQREEGAAATAIDQPIILRGGEIASPGVAAGPACLVKSNLDLLTFPEGGVLVTALAHPGWATLLPRAAAVVTDRGSITGHLANVAREFGLPALFNTGEATQKIEAGAVITVDADGHTVYQGRVDSLLQAQPAKKGLMAGTPVHETLKEVMAYITPLNLTDPDSRDFGPKYCQTLHDITRFAHEVSVKEMFAIDQHKALHKYFIKRLKIDLPMQWFVLNLEDGFKEETPGKEVELGNIASIPMLALWEGITAVPWEGPPPVDTKGFLSIVMGAATDPNLATAGGTIYGNQNYFMISKNFCNLTSRLGFHFSTVEALTGAEAFENYLRFNFKGGAADQPRRVLRAKFVAEILEGYDFKVEVKEDALFARLEGEPIDYMLTRLKVLGYVTIHTRQLDMIMLNEAEVQYYRDKILKDLKNLVPPRQDA